jgi:nucleotide-binding universal stress UspA family protein
MTTHLTVGFDGSAPSIRAVVWAAGEAERRGAGLQVVACYSPPAVVSPWYGTVPYDLDLIHDEIEADMAKTTDQARRDHPGVSIASRVVLGSPRTELLRESDGSELLVVGSTGAGAVESWLLGSVAHAVSRSARCPVVLVPNVHLPRDVGRVVVGVDGSPAADAALDWAIDEADRRDAELVVIHVWHYPYGTELDDAEGRDLMRVDAALVLDRAMERANEVARGPVVGKLVDGGTAADVLVALGRDADLVVVGSRGRGGLRSTLFGSVAHAAAERSTGPTVIVRAPEVV